MNGFDLPQCKPDSSLYSLRIVEFVNMEYMSLLSRVIEVLSVPSEIKQLYAKVVK